MYIDVDVLLALIKKDDRHKEYAEKILAAAESAYTSVVSLLELEIVVKREISDVLSKGVVDLVLDVWPKLKIVNLDKEIFERSLELRKSCGLGIFDSIHAATALKFDGRVASTDHVYARIEGLALIK